MPFHVVATSVRGHEDTLSGGFDTPQQAIDHVVKELRGVSAIWQVWIENSDLQRVVRGFRSGYCGTGVDWTWERVP